jgi:hypothetical protein
VALKARAVAVEASARALRATATPHTTIEETNRTAIFIVVTPGAWDERALSPTRPRIYIPVA